MSGLVFPGMGQISLKHHKRGVAMILTVSVSLVVITVEAVQRAKNILEEIMLEGGAIDMNTITNAATEATRTSDNLIFKLALLLIVLCWIIGIVDAYIMGKKKDIKEESASQL